MASLPKRISAASLGLLVILLTSGLQAGQREATQPIVAVVRAIPVSLAQADAAREGAAELVVLMEIARVQSRPEKGGLVGVGNRRGLISGDTEEALRRAVLSGVPVVKLAPQGEVLTAPHGLFLDGGHLSVEAACAVLEQCLIQFGALPVVDSAQPSKRELAALQNHLRTFQQQLNRANPGRLAIR
jgi:hypothetical protein